MHRWLFFGVCLFGISVGLGCDDSGETDSSSLSQTDTQTGPEDAATLPDTGQPETLDVTAEDVSALDVLITDVSHNQADEETGQEDTPESDVSVDVVESGPIALPTGLIGTPIDNPTLPPEFVSVVDSDGNEVTAADLLGSPTVLWFFPFPSTPG